MLKRFVIALSVTASALLLPATAAQAADATVTATATTPGESGAATTTAVRQIHTPSGVVVTVGTTTGGLRVSDPSDSSWGG